MRIHYLCPSHGGDRFITRRWKGRGGEKGCKIEDFYSPYLFKESSLKGFFPPSLNTFHFEKQRHFFFLLSIAMTRACRDGLSTQLEGFESSYSESIEKGNRVLGECMMGGSW